MSAFPKSKKNTTLKISLWGLLLAEKRDDRAHQKKWNGPSPGGAAGDLGVSRQRIHQLLSKGILESITLTDYAGRKVALIVTDESIERYKASERKPGPKAKEA